MAIGGLFFQRNLAAASKEIGEKEIEINQPIDGNVQLLYFD